MSSEHCPYDYCPECDEAAKDATIVKLQAVLKDIAYSGIHMTVGEIRERALDAIKEVEQ